MLGADTDVLQCCDAICPNPSAADFHQKCADHTYHLEYTEWQDAAYQQSTLQWNVFFVAFSLLLGATVSQRARVGLCWVAIPGLMAAAPPPELASSRSFGFSSA